MNKNWNKKPPNKVRSVNDALVLAELKRSELPDIVQVYASDWDRIILADEIYRLRKIIKNVQSLTNVV